MAVSQWAELESGSQVNEQNFIECRYNDSLSFFPSHPVESLNPYPTASGDGTMSDTPFQTGEIKCRLAPGHVPGSGRGTVPGNEGRSERHQWGNTEYIVCAPH